MGVATKRVWAFFVSYVTTFVRRFYRIPRTIAIFVNDNRKTFSIVVIDIDIVCIQSGRF